MRIQVALASVALACGDPSAPQSGEQTLIAVGDIAGCTSTGDEAVAALLDTVPGPIATLGDNVYLEGSTTQFTNCFEPSWGRHKARIRPSVGNHDWSGGTLDGYFDYFGEAAGPRNLGYYSYDLGAWHIIALNSEIDTGPQSAQVAWLMSDLAANPRGCTLAYWHRPRFNSGDHLSDTRMAPLWDALYAANADLVLNGHEHDYERFAPQSPEGIADPVRGIREFVVGTGGFQVELSFPDNREANSEFRNGSTFGVLRLKLRPDSYSWDFIATENWVLDSGAGRCH